MTASKTCLLRRTFRKDGKVQHETPGNISHLPEPLVDLIRRSFRGDAVGTGPCKILRSLPHGHVAAVLGALRGLGLERILGSRRGRQRDGVTALIVARLLEPTNGLTASAV